MLMSAGLPLPRQVFGHGFMTIDGQRMSKSLGTIVDPVDAAARHGVDPLRLYLAKEIVFGSDGDFSWERYDERYNADLANNLGNLVSRVSAMAERYRGGRLTPAGASGRLAGAGARAVAAYRSGMDRLMLHEGAAAAFGLVDATNEFIADTAPWTLAKDPSAGDRLTQSLYDAAEAVRLAAVLLTPMIPKSSAEILRRIGAPADSPRLDRDGVWRNEGERSLRQEGPLWPRAEVNSRIANITTMTDNPTPTPPAAATPQPAPAASPAAAPQAAPGGDRISIDDFMKVELRVAKVIAAERVPKSNKLIKLQVDVGTEQRTLVAGIAEAYEPEALVGRSVAIVYNLKPAKLMGIESNGMVLAASPEGGKPTLVGFDQPPAPGTRVR
jgi:methionyl-tRNA synthetase